MLSDLELTGPAEASPGELLEFRLTGSPAHAGRQVAIAVGADDERFCAEKLLPAWLDCLHTSFEEEGRKPARGVAPVQHRVTLDEGGAATIQVQVPTDATLAGATFWVNAAVLDPPPDDQRAERIHDSTGFEVTVSGE